MTLPTIGPGPSPTTERVTNAQAARILAFLILYGSFGIPLTILAWKVAIAWPL